jgi:hypothetical protein
LFFHHHQNDEDGYIHWAKVALPFATDSRGTIIVIGCFSSPRNFIDDIVAIAITVVFRMRYVSCS